MKMGFLVFVFLVFLHKVNSDCVWNGTGGSGQIDCSLRILDFRRDAGAGSLAGLLENRRENKVQRLTVKCSEGFFFESQLRYDDISVKQGHRGWKCVIHL